MSLIYLLNVTTNRANFEKKVIDISAKLGINPNWLMAVMYIESCLNHKAVNFQKGDDLDPAQRCKYRATGLIQFMPNTAKRLGVTTSDLLLMSNVDQLGYVYQYLKPYTGKMKRFVDVYFAVFFPAAMGKPADYVMKTQKLSAAVIAKQNSGYDLDKNQEITVQEVETVILSRINSAYHHIIL